MARPKKEKNKIEDAATHAPPNTISIPQFMHTRDSVVTGLTTLQQSVGILLQSYIDYTNRILAGNSLDGLNLNTITNPLNAAGAIAGVPAAEADGKPKRKRALKKPKDPNAPRRPLTAFFLYLHHARPVIRAELGPDASPGQIAELATKRWSDLSEESKHEWKARYNVSFEAFKEMKKEYETTGTFHILPGYEDQVQDLDLQAEIAAIPAETADAAETGTTSSDVSDADTDDDTDSDPKKKGAAESPREPTPPSKFIKPEGPKSSKRRRADKNGDADIPHSTGQAASSFGKTTISPTPVGAASGRSAESKEKSPEKKKKRSRKSKGDEERADENGETPQPMATPAPPRVADKSEKSEKKRSRKRKSEAIDG